MASRTMSPPQNSRPLASNNLVPTTKTNDNETEAYPSDNGYESLVQKQLRWTRILAALLAFALLVGATVGISFSTGSA